MKTLKISKEVTLPVDVVTQTIAILAKRRVGKSYTMRKVAEQLLEADQQVVIIDPKGDQWGIRSSSDGKKPGYPVVILGGEHGDAPLEVNSGEVVARLVVEERVSALIDLSTFRKHEVATFMAIFLENLYRLKAQERHRTPVMLVVDEADAIAPQKPQKGEERMLGAIEDIVRRGGQRGVGCILVTQRSAVLNKNVLTQAQILIVLRTIAPQDIAAMKAWIDVHGSVEQGKELIESLPSLPIGDAWFWSPGYPTAEGIFKRTHVLPITTFDSAATPKPGEKRVAPKSLADVDLEALKKQMAATIEKAKNEDPKLLKKRVLELETENTRLKTNSKPLGDSNEQVKAMIDKAVKEAVIQKERQYDKERSEMIKQTNNFLKIIRDVGKVIAKVVPEFEPVKDIQMPDLKHRIEVKKNYKDIFEYEKVPNIIVSSDPIKIMKNIHAFNPEATETEQPLKAGAMKMLNWIAGASGLSESRLATLSGFSVNGGTFKTYISQLRRNGWIEGKEVLTVTANGLRHAQPEEIPTGEELLRMWQGKFKAGIGKMLELLYHNQRMSKQALAQLSGFEMSGGTFKTYLSILGRNGLISVKGDMVEISQEFFD